MKTPERAHSPAKMWERKKLSKNYAQALAQVKKALTIDSRGIRTDLSFLLVID